MSDKYGRRPALIIPAMIGCLITPLYMLTTDWWWIAIGFTLLGAFAGAMYGQNPSYLTERFPTEVRATASAFCYHQGAIFGGLMPPMITWFAIEMGYGFAWPMVICTTAAIVSFAIAVLLGPETKGQVFTSEPEVLKASQAD